MQGGSVQDKALEKIGQKLLEKKFNLSSLSDQELAEVAVRFTGDAPPAHIPRETVIEILSQQDSVQSWATSVKERGVPKAKEVVTKNIRNRVQGLQSSIQSQSDTNPVAAALVEKFGEWLNDTGYTPAQLTQMLDVNSDGVISNNEATNFIKTISKSKPPQMVIDSLMDFMDENGDGTLTVTEWWAFLESIGLENPVVESETEAELETSSEIQALEEVNVDQEQAARIMAEANEKALEEMKKQEEELRNLMASDTSADSSEEKAPDTHHEDNVEHESEVHQPDKTEIDNTQTESEEEEEAERVAISSESISWEIENPNEIMIEKLEHSRLSSEADAIIAVCNEHLCALRVEEVERTLLAKNEFRGGYTVVGEIDGGPFSAGVMFPESDNDAVLEFKIGSMINCFGRIIKWSSGRKQAVLEGRDPFER